MVLSLIVGAIASVGAAIAGAVTTVGTAASSFAASIAPKLGTLLSTAKTYAEPVLKFANTLMQAVDILKPGETIESFGERALQAAAEGNTMDGKSFDEYMSMLRGYEIDPEKSEKRSLAEKMVAGMAVGTVGLEHKFNADKGSLNNIWLLPLSNNSYFTPERIKDWLAAGNFGGDALAYLNNLMSGGAARSFEKSFEVEANGKAMNDVEKEKLYAALDDAREHWAEISQKIEAADKQA